MARHARRESRRTDSDRWHAFRLSGAEAGVSVLSAVIFAGTLYVSASGNGVQQQIVSKTSLDDIVSERVADGGSLLPGEKLPEALRGMLPTAEAPPPERHVERESEVRADSRSLQPLPTVTSTVTVTASPGTPVVDVAPEPTPVASQPMSEVIPVDPDASVNVGPMPSKESTRAPISTPDPAGDSEAPTDEPSEPSDVITPAPSDSAPSDSGEDDNTDDDKVLEPSPSPGATDEPPLAPRSDDVDAQPGSSRGGSDGQAHVGGQSSIVVPLTDAASQN